MTDPELPVSAGAPLIESLNPARNLTMAIHEGFTSIHQAPVDHVSREPQRVAAPSVHHPTPTRSIGPDSVIDHASVSFQAV